MASSLFLPWDNHRPGLAVDEQTGGPEVTAPCIGHRPLFCVGFSGVQGDGMTL